MCDETQECRSIEWSPSRNHCVILRAKNADGPQWEDYRFCSKNVDTGILSKTNYVINGAKKHNSYK